MARARLTRIVLILGTLFVLVGIGVAVWLPRWLKSRIIATAAAHGVTLTVDDLSIAPGRARLHGVRATPLIRSDRKGAPTITMTATNVDVTLDGLTPSAVAISNAAFDLDGAATDVADVLTSRDQASSGPTTLTRVTLTDASLTWRHPLGTNLVAIHALHTSWNVEQKPGRSLGQDWHLEIPELHVFEVAGKTSGSGWSAVVDADAVGTRASVALGKGATMKSDLAATGARSLDIDTPSLTVVDAGIPAEALGLYADETSPFELHVHHRQTDKTHAEGTLVASASNVFLGASPARTTLAMDIRYAGDPTTSMLITAGTLTAGPFSGPLTGSFAANAESFKATIQYQSGALSCRDAVKEQAASYGPAGAGIAALAGMLGLDRVVEGNVRLQGDIAIDTATNERRASFRTAGDCKLSYLPAP